MWIRFWQKIGKIEITSIGIEMIEKKTGEDRGRGIMTGKISTKNKISIRGPMMIEGERNEGLTFQRSHLILNIYASINSQSIVVFFCNLSMNFDETQKIRKSFTNI